MILKLSVKTGDSFEDVAEIRSGLIFGFFDPFAFSTFESFSGPNMNTGPGASEYMNGTVFKAFSNFVKFFLSAGSCNSGVEGAYRLLHR